MSYKTMAIYLDGGKDSSRKIEFAIGLAMQYDAHLRGLALSYISPFVFDLTCQSAALIIELEEAQAERVKETKALFDTEAKLSGLGFDTVSFQVNNIDEIAQWSRTSDLVIVEQSSPDDDSAIPTEGFVQHLLPKLGRPMLLLPHKGVLPARIERVMIAWDGSKESGRALADAMPFLQKAKAVKLLTIVDQAPGRKYLPNVDIASYLARHGVNVELDEQESPVKEPSAWLLANTSNYGADLLVMGGYGHSRLSELLLGGMTQSIFADVRLPILMSH